MCRDRHKRRLFSSKAEAKRFIRRYRGDARFRSTRPYFCEDCGVWRITSSKPRPVTRASKSPDELVKLAEHIQRTNPDWTWWRCLLRAGKHA